MAIDTRNKRMSFVGFGQVGIVLPNPDGTIATADRIQALHLYPGILPGGGGPVTYTQSITYTLALGASVVKKVKKPIGITLGLSSTIVKKAKKNISLTLGLTPTIVRKTRKSFAITMALGASLTTKFILAKAITHTMVLGASITTLFIPFNPAAIGERWQHLKITIARKLGL